MKELTSTIAYYRPMWDEDSVDPDPTTQGVKEALSTSKAVVRPLAGQTYRLADRIKVRKERFGAMVQNRYALTTRYFDNETYQFLLDLKNPLKAEQLLRFVDFDDVGIISLLFQDGTISTVEAGDFHRTSSAEFFDFTSDKNSLLFSTPAAVEIEPTLKCSRNCDYCAYNSSPQVDRSTEKPTGFWIQKIQEAASLGAFSIEFTGGDPLQRGDIVELLCEANNLGMFVTINTDLTVLPEHVASVLPRLQNLNAIQITLDGPDASTHDKHRGNGAFKTLTENIDRLVTRSVRVNAGMVLTKSNVLLVAETASFCSAIGVSGLYVTSLYNQGRATSMIDQAPAKSELAAASQAYAKAVFSGVVNSTERAFYSQRDLYFGSPATFNHLDDIAHMASPGMIGIRIDPRGQFVTSIKFAGSSYYEIGDAEALSLKNVWESSATLQTLRCASTAYPTNAFKAVDIRLLPA